MTGYVMNAAGESAQLPVLTQWEVLRCGGEDGCDSFFCMFPVEATDAQLLENAVTFYAEHDGERVFTGVVDEVNLTLDERGRLGRVDGRGMAARLLDNQTRSAEYDSAQLSDILRDYVTPFGIQTVCASLPPVAHFAVDTGDTCRQAVWGYVRHAGAAPPRFDAYGRLLIGQSAEQFSLTQAAAPFDVRYTRTRYGVLTEVVEVRAATGADVKITTNPRDGLLSARRVTVVSGTTVRAERRTGAQAIALSERDGRLVELSLSGAFLAQPDERCMLSLPTLGIAGDFTVRTVRSRASGAGEICTITMGGA